MMWLIVYVEYLCVSRDNMTVAYPITVRRVLLVVTQGGASSNQHK